MIKHKHAFVVIAALIALLGSARVQAQTQAAPPNVLFITVDDMNCDSVGAFGCQLPGTTPHIDALARQGLRFQHAHVQVGNCMPSRNVMFSGLYPHNNGVEGFRQAPGATHPHLVDLMKARGYFTGIRHKVNHSTPYTPYGWDVVLDDAQGKPNPKNIQSYYDSAKMGIAASREAGKPFCLVINVSDPHKPFYGMGARDSFVDDPNTPSHIFTPEEVPIPGFLFDHPDVRKELSHYYSSVRRADDCVGMVLKALDDSGQADNTVVFFLSDHGMPLPFAKTAVYYHSTHTPLIVRWPGVTRPNSVDGEHMVSAVDLLSTICEIVGIQPPERQDGRSFLPLIKGQPQEGRDYVFAEYSEMAGGVRQPMRSVQTKRFGYIFNPWSDGKRVVRTATQGTMTYRTMKKVAPDNPEVAARLEMFDHRLVEEFYDYANDADALNNLSDDPRYQAELNQHRKLLEEHMVRTADPALEAFRHRHEADFLAKYMQQQDDISAANQKRRNRRNADGGEGDAPIPLPAGKRSDLISLSVPETAAAGGEVIVIVKHTIPKRLGEQRIHVTLKQGKEGQRVDRQVLSASGSGELKVTFKVPATVVDQTLSCAAFVGKDFPSSLQHVASGRIGVVTLR